MAIFIAAVLLLWGSSRSPAAAERAASLAASAALSAAAPGGRGFRDPRPSVAAGPAGDAVRASAKPHARRSYCAARRAAAARRRAAQQQGDRGMARRSFAGCWSARKQSCSAFFLPRALAEALKSAINAIARVSPSEPGQLQQPRLAAENVLALQREPRIGRQHATDRDAARCAAALPADGRATARRRACMS